MLHTTILTEVAQYMDAVDTAEFVRTFLHQTEAHVQKKELVQFRSTQETTENTLQFHTLVSHRLLDLALLLQFRPEAAMQRQAAARV